MKRLLILILVASHSVFAQPIIFGTTSAGGNFAKGTIYSINPDGTNYQVLHHFDGTDGAQPMGHLTRLPDGRLVGVCFQGGDTNVPGTTYAVNDGGVVFSINEDGSGFEVLYSFNLEVAGYINGAQPSFGVLHASDGKLYGTTTSGGGGDGGILYRINTDGTGFQILLNFTGTGTIKGIPVEIPGNFVIFSAGGTIYKYNMNDPSPGSYTPTIMTQMLGITLNNTPTLFSDGKLYGTTSTGGVHGEGFVYSINLASPLFYTTLHSFPQYFQQYSSLTEGQDGSVFGTFARNTFNGGVFRLNKDGTGFSIITETGTAGTVAILAQATDGSFYCYNNSSGFHSGTGYNVDYLFRINNDGSNLTTVRSFGADQSAYGFNNLDERKLLFLNSAPLQPQTINFTLAPSTVDLNSPPIILTGSSTSGMDLTYISSDPSKAIIHGDTLIIMGAGDVTITALQYGNYEYSAAAPVSQPLTVNRLPQTIIFDPLVGTYAAGDQVPMTATASSNLPVTYTTSDPTAVNVYLGVAYLYKAGTYTITASQPGNVSYLPATPVSQLITVNQGSQFITFDPLPEVAVDQGSYTLQAYSSSGLPISYTSSDPSIAIISGNILTPLTPGTVTITASQPGDANFLPAIPVSQPLVIKPNSQYITFFVPSATYGDPDFTLNAVASSGLTPITYSSSDPTVISISGNMATILQAGSAVITATQAGDANYISASSSQLVTINQATQIITFDPLPPLSVGDPELFATSSSGLPVTFTSSDTTLAIIQGNNLICLRSGWVTITAEQAGNQNYLPTLTSQTAFIDRGQQTITFNPIPASVQVGSSPINLVATASSGLLVSFNSSDTTVASINGNQIIIKNSGVVSITASQPGNEDYYPATDVAQLINVIGSIDQADSVALVSFYNATLGNSWTNKTNWLTGPARNWFGVTLNGAGRVTHLQLPNNNVRGGPPADFSALTALQVLNLQQNIINFNQFPSLNSLVSLTTLNLNASNVSALPGMSGMPNLTSIDIRNNPLTFDDLEPVAMLPGIQYIPQQQFGLGAGNVTVIEGGTIWLNMFCGGSANQYQWYKGGVPVSSATTNPYALGNVQLIDGGTYQLQVTNPLVPGLTLYGATIPITVVSPTAQTYFTWTINNGIDNDLPTDSYGGYWADIDNDGDEDLAINNLQASLTGRSVDLHENLGNGTFSRLINAGMPTADGPRNIAWADYDNDGDLDFYVGDAAFNTATDFKGDFYRNNGDKTFTRVPLDQLADGGVWADYDNDGFVDLFIVDSGQPTSVYRNNQNGTFSVVPGMFNQGADWTLAFADIDNDRDLDLLQVGRNGDITRNNLWRNNGNSTFTEMTTSAVNTTNMGSARGASWADFDNDGDLDLFAPSATPAQPSRFFMNDGTGNFTAQTALSVLGVNVATSASALGDVDNDGDVDLIINNSVTGNVGTRLFLNNGNGSFTQVSVGVQSFLNVSTLAHLSMGDYDNDGFLDLVAATFNTLQAPALYRNTGNSNHWVKFKLTGLQSNRSAIGARVEMVAGGMKQIREVTTQTGLAAQNSLIQHFGTAGNTVVDTVRIYWPAGNVQELVNLPTDQLYEIEESLSPPSVPASNFVFSNVTANSMSVAFTPGNGTGRLVIARPMANVTFLPVNNTTYSVGQDVGNGEVVLYVGDSTQFDLANLQPDTEYHFTFFEYRQEGSVISYALTGADTLQATQPAMMWGSYGSGPGQFIYVHDVEVAPDGTVVVADPNNNRIQKFSAGGRFLWQASATNAFGIGIDKAGNIYVASGNANPLVKVFTADGILLREIIDYGTGPGKFGGTYDVAVDASNTLLVTGYGPDYKVEKFDTLGNYLGQFPYSTGGIPIRIETDGSQIYLSPWNNSQIYIYTNDGQNVDNFSSASAIAVDVDSLGFIYSANHLAHTVNEYDTNGNLLFSYGTGSPGLNYLQFNHPYGLASNRNATKLYVADLNNSRIQVIDITKQPQIVNFAAIGSLQFSTAPYILSATSTSGNPLVFTSSDPSIVSVNGNQLSFHGLGPVTITAYAPGTHEYKPATVTQVINIIKGDQTITFNPLPNKEVGDLPFYLEAFSSSGRPVSYHSDNLAVAYINGDQVRVAGPGTATITASQPGDAFFNAAAPVTQTITVSAGAARIFGLNSQSGIGGQGTAYSIKQDGTGFQVLYSFAQLGQYSNTSFQLGTDGYVYGSTQYSANGIQNGTLFKFKSDFSEYYHLKEFGGTDGTIPQSIALSNDGYIYGNTNQGGQYGGGTIFRIRKDGTNYQVLYHFAFNGTGKIILGMDGKVYGHSYHGGVNDDGVLYRLEADGSLTILHDFQPAEGRPNGHITEYAPGIIAGVCYSGGAYGYGSVFKVNTDGTGFHVMKSFGYGDGHTPTGRLLYYNGLLYGGTTGGGSVANTGLLFSINPQNDAYQILHEFAADNSEGSYFNGGLSVGLDGYFYGGTFYGGDLSIPSGGGGTIFKIDTTGNFTVLRTLSATDGYRINREPLLLPDGNLMFSTYYNDVPGQGGGSIITITPDGSQFKRLVNYGSAPFGKNPEGTMAGLPDGKLAGVARYGGSENKGVVFELDHDGYSLKLLHDFNSVSSSADAQQPSQGVMLGSDGALYGATSPSGSYPGYVYRLGSDSTGYSELATLDQLVTPGYGDIPSRLIELPSGELVGTSFYGGPNLGGYIYKLNKNGSNFSRIYEFTTATVGLYPAAIMQATDGRLYATCYQGGDLSAYIGGFGSVVSLKPDGSEVQRIFAFNDNNGKLPYGQLLEGLDGNLYGTASFHGGNNASGLVFKVSKSGTSYSILKQFDGSEGNTPYHGLAQAADGRLWGTNAGGLTGGTLFSLSPDGSGFTTLRNFDATSGTYPSYGNLLFYNINGRQPQTITFDSLNSVAFGSGPITLNATSSSGLPVHYSSSDPTVASVNGNVLTILKVGSVTITAYQQGNYNFTAAAPVAQLLTIDKANQTITFFPLPTKTLEEPDFDLQAFSSAHLWLTYTSSDTLVAKIEGHTLKLVGPGTATITASQAGNEFYNAAASVSQDITLEEPLAGQERLFITLPHGSSNGSGSVVSLHPDGSNVNIRPMGANEGTYPVAALTYYDGAFYGTTQSGGRYGVGTIYRVNADGSEFYTLHHFDGSNSGALPWAKLLAASDGYLYGTTVNGGSNNVGVAFRIYPDGTHFQKLFDFGGANGVYPYGSLLEGQDGYVYGTTYSGNGSYGTIFKLAKDGTAYLKLHDFNSVNGAYPHSGLVQDAQGKLFGTTYHGYNGSSNYSTIYSINSDGSAFTVLAYLNGGNGQNILSPLLIGADGILYGTAHSGGAYNTGTIFKINRDGTGFAMLYTFGSSNSDSRHPGYSGLISLPNGKLYGTTFIGGASGTGTIYSFDPVTYQFNRLLDFSAINGQTPHQGVTPGPDSQLYGTTFYGGTGNAGVVYKVAPDGSNYTKLKEFNNQTQQTGVNPYGELTQLEDGSYMGTARSGGVNGLGTIFKLNKYGFGLTKTYDFANTGGWYPLSGLTQATDGRLYGTTNASTPSGRGTIYSVNSNGTDHTQLLQLDNATGGHPIWNKLTETENGKLIGNMDYVPGGYGRVFSIAKDGSQFQSIADFYGSNGSYPRGKLAKGTDGFYYGTAATGGSYGYGTIFKVREDGSDFQILRSLNQSAGEGAYPNAGVILGFDGMLYGTTSYYSSSDYGIIFRINTDGSNFTKIYEFTGATGADPRNGLIQGQDSTLYGATWQGGMYGNGVIYKIKPDGTGYERLLNLSNQIGYQPYSPILISKTPGRSQTITFDPLVAATYGDAPVSLIATASSGLAVSYTSSDTTMVSIVGNVATFKNAGTVTITAQQPGNGIYSAAPEVSQNLVVNPATLTVTARDTTKVYGTPNPEFALSYSGFVGADSPLDIDTAPTLSCIATDTTSVGDYPITVSGGTDNNYVFTYVAGTLTISPASQSIVFEPIAPKEPTDPPFTLLATASSGLPVNFTSSDTTILEISGNLATIAGAGTVVITATQPGNQNYLPANPVQQTLLIEPNQEPEPLVNSSGLVFNPVYSTQMTLSFAPGDGDRHLVVIRSLNPVAFEPEDGVGYSVNQDLGNDHRVVSVDSSDVINITGLMPGTLYHVAIFEYKGENLRANYKVPGAIGSRTTLVLPNVYVTSPANGATGINITTNVTARALTGATTYTIQLSPLADFSSGVLEKSGTRTQNFAGLQYNTMYYTRVKTDLSPDFGAVTSFTTFPASALAYVTSPANNAVNVNTVVSITSNTVPGAASYTIELSETPGFETLAFTITGPSRTLAFSGLKYNTLYYNRVKTDLSATPGQVRSFTTRTAESIAYVTSPANNAVNVNNTSLNITANNVPGAASYTIELSEFPDFSTVAFSQTGPTRTLPFAGLKYNTVYYNRVLTDVSGTYGQVRSFTTRTAESLAYVTSPANGAINVAYNVNVRSNTVPGASLYTIELNTASDFSGSSIVQTSGSTTIAFALSYNTTYYSRVMTDLSSVWGQTRSFTTNSPLFYSFMTSPANGASNVNYVTNITANSVPGAGTYIIEANTASDFTGTSILRMGSGRTYSFTLAYNTTYYVRVQTNLLPGEWGETRSFTTGDPQSIAYVTNPANNAVNVPTTVNVTANLVSGATQYTIELNTASDFSGPSIIRTGSRTQAFNLNQATQYFSRVTTNLTPGLYGPVRNFTTVDPLARLSADPVIDEEPVVETAVSVDVFPNPFKTTVTILVQTQKQEELDLELIDMMGRVINRVNSETNQLLKLEGDYSPGVYLLRVKFKSGVQTIRLVRE